VGCGFSVVVKTLVDVARKSALAVEVGRLPSSHAPVACTSINSKIVRMLRISLTQEQLDHDVLRHMAHIPARTARMDCEWRMSASKPEHLEPLSLGLTCFHGIQTPPEHVLTPFSTPNDEMLRSVLVHVLIAR
jgi:hypothetical protein